MPEAASVHIHTCIHTQTLSPQNNRLFSLSLFINNALFNNDLVPAALHYCVCMYTYVLTVS